MLGKLILSLLTIICLLANPRCNAQKSITVSDPRLELKGSKLLINYDILNSNLKDKFFVGLEIKDIDGNLLNTRALSGDIGEGITGGNNKLIIWDLNADKIFMDSDILVDIYVRPLSVDEPSILNNSGETELSNSERNTEVKGFSRSSIMLQSLVLPGLGLSRVTGKPHWIRGVAGYCCIGGSIYLNRKAIATYENFRSATEPQDAETLFSTSTTQDMVSEVLAYAAIGIWVSDIIWTLLGTSDLNKEGLNSQSRGFSIKTSLDCYTEAPLIGICYRF